MRTRGHTTAAPAIAEDYHGTPGQQDVGCAYDRVDRALACTVTVIKQVLGVGIVDRQHGEAQYAVSLHAAQPDDARGGLFHATDNSRNQFGACCMQR